MMGIQSSVPSGWSAGRHLLPVAAAAVAFLLAAVGSLGAEAPRPAGAARAEALAAARRAGWPVRAADAEGREVVEIAALRRGAPPLYRATTNANAAITNGADVLLLAPWGLDGSGVIVGVWDGGNILTTHQEFTGRATAMDGGELTSHGTHVAGTIGAAGINPIVQGMAPATTLRSYDWDEDDVELRAAGAATAAAAAAGVRLSNHSYGFITGWRAGDFAGTGSNAYYWWGVWGEAEDRGFGMYDASAELTDEIIHERPYLLVVKSAGNDRGEGWPADGDTFYYWDEVNEAWATATYDSAIHPPADAFDDGGYDTVSYWSGAKNVLTVGAVNDGVIGGGRAPAEATMSSFSCWGPVDDGRIKPDIVTNGVSLFSTGSGSITQTYSASGTSMATPSATGTIALLLQLHDRLFGAGASPSAATLKALVLHTATDVGRPGPDYQNGWGLLDGRAAAAHLELAAAWPDARHLVDATLAASARAATYEVDYLSVSGGPDLRATLVWTDPAGTARSALDDPTPALVNDLDLRLEHVASGTTFLPWRLDRLAPAADATTGDNTVDNVEQVVARAGAAPSGRYRVTVTHKGATLQPAGAQRFSLALSGQAPDALGVVAVAGPGAGEVTHHLANFAAVDFDWAATSANGWVTCTPPAGGLVAGATTSFVAAASGEAFDRLPGGFHRTDVLVTHALAAPGSPARRFPFTATRPGAARLPFRDAFDADSLRQPWWTIVTTGTGAAGTSNVFGPDEGTHHVLLGGYRTNSTGVSAVMLTADLAGWSDVELEFVARNIGDEAHGVSSPFTGTPAIDGVAISADGVTWREVQPLRQADIGPTARRYVIDLDAAAAAGGLAYNATFRVRFSQYDNFPLPDDGIVIDDVRLRGTPPAPFPQALGVR